MNLWNETKSLPVSREMVWAAYKKVKANKGSAGVDEISMDEFDADRSKHLYKLWNRMASGSYFPPPVKEVEISKKDGGIRKLGVPTIADRIGQMVRNRTETISYAVLPLANWIIELKRLDLYNKSRVMGDYQARFCERLRVKLPLPTRPINR